jgi:hypothetical protein
MAWVKIDDQFFMHPKVIAAGRDARDLYLAALTYTAGQLTDGFVPAGALPLIAAMAGVPDAADLAARLVDVRLWEPTAGGYNIHDYHEYNPSAEQVRATREARAEAGRRGGLAAAASKAEANDQANGEQNSTPSPSPSPSQIPDPVPGDAEAAGASAPTTKQAKRRARPSKADPRTSTPAIQCAYAVAGKKYPPLEVYDRIIAALGDRPDGAKLRQCRAEWIDRGYNPGAWKWATEWYVDGIPPRGPARASPGNGHRPAPNDGVPRGKDAIAAWLAQKEGERGE